MALPSTALPSETAHVYKVDFPLKPGENRIELTYVLPHEDGGEFTVRSMYPTLETRVAGSRRLEPGGLGHQPVRDASRSPTWRSMTSSTPDRLPSR